MRSLELRILNLENTVKFLTQKNAELEKILKNTISFPIPKNYEIFSFLNMPVVMEVKKQKKTRARNDR